MLKGAKN